MSAHELSSNGSCSSCLDAISIGTVEDCHVWEVPVRLDNEALSLGNRVIREVIVKNQLDHIRLLWDILEL